MRAFPDTTGDPAEFFHGWVSGEDGHGDPGAGFFVMENSFWSVRRDPNVVMVHYNDLKADLDGEMRRIARFLDIDVEEPLWSQMVQAAGFAAMKRDGPKIIPHAEMSWEGVSQRFLFKGTNGRWRDCVSKADLAAYEARVKAEFSPALARRVEYGRAVAGDPATSPD